MVSIGSLYYLIPRMFGKIEMYSPRLVEVHFWTATIGVVLYIAAMWIAGVMQGLMWRAVNADGTLTYSFIESVERTYPFYYVRLLGGALFLVGMLLMAYNVWKTAAQGRAEDADDAIPAPAAH
jgi:cytochrome c oxidase cbb3-type subunit 1